MRERKYFLRGLNGPLTNREFLLMGPEVHIGRTSENDIVINEKNVSRHHASVFIDNDNFRIEDQKSRNGVYVNGEKVEGAQLKTSDLIDIGGSRFRVLREGFKLPEIPSKEVLHEFVRNFAQFKEPLRKIGVKRLALYLVAICILQYAFSSSRHGITLESRNLEPAPRLGVPALTTQVAEIREASDDQVLGWWTKANRALQYDDVVAAIPLLRNIVSARPTDMRARALLERAETRTSYLIRKYYENGVKEYEKLYYERAVQEWQKVLALSSSFDLETYRRAESKITEVREKLAQKE